MNLIKVILISLGTISLCIGVIGIAVPGLPVTPFILLTAALYVRSSDRLYNKLITNRIVGPYIVRFRANKGMTGRAKQYAIITMWIMIATSCIFFINPSLIKLMVLIAGIIGTIVMGFIIPTINNSNSSNK